EELPTFDDDKKKENEKENPDNEKELNTEDSPKEEIKKEEPKNEEEDEEFIDPKLSQSERELLRIRRMRLKHAEKLKEIEEQYLKAKNRLCCINVSLMVM